MHLLSLGHFHPPEIVTNELLEELDIGTDDAWITERVGIKTRHTVLPLDYIRRTKNRDVRGAAEAAQFSNAQTSKHAAELALARAGLQPKDIGLVVAGGCSPDEHIPSQAARIAEALGIASPCFDIQAACSSFCAALHVLDSMRIERLPEHILVVNPENSTRVVDYSDRSSCVLWGDATTAAVLSPHKAGRWNIVDTLLAGDPSGADKVKVPRFGHFTQVGPAVQTFAIKKSTDTFVHLRAAYLQRGLARGEDRTQGGLTLVGHQANLRMLEAVARRGEVADAKHFYNVDRRGNCGAAGAPSVMSERWDDDDMGDAIAMCVVGAGLAWSGVLLERA